MRCHGVEPGRALVEGLVHVEPNSMADGRPHLDPARTADARPGIHPGRTAGGQPHLEESWTPGGRLHLHPGRAGGEASDLDSNRPVLAGPVARSGGGVDARGLQGSGARG